jgi:hypothetical protein
MDRVSSRVVHESVEGVPIYRDLVVLSMRSGGKGGEEDGTEEEVLEKHGGRVWRRWASGLLWYGEVSVVEEGDFFWLQSTGRKKVGMSALHGGCASWWPAEGRINLLSLCWRHQKATWWCRRGLSPLASLGDESLG